MGTNIWTPSEILARKKCFEGNEPLVKTLTWSWGAGPGPTVIADNLNAQWTADQDYLLLRLFLSHTAWNNQVFGPTADGTTEAVVTTGLISGLSPGGGPFQLNTEILLSSLLKCDAVGGGSVGQVAADFGANPKIVKAGTNINVIGWWNVVLGGIDSFGAVNMHLIQLFT